MDLCWDLVGCGLRLLEAVREEEVEAEEEEGGAEEESSPSPSLASKGPSPCKMDDPTSISPCSNVSD